MLNSLNPLIRCAVIPTPRSTVARIVCRRPRARKMTTAPSNAVPKFVHVDGGKAHLRNNPEAIRFSLVSYNILAQTYLKSTFFPHSPSTCLKWKSRSQAIITVLKNLCADFFCLQELDEYESFYKQNMESLGYSSLYIKRSGTKRDGCGIFYKGGRAAFLMEEKIKFNDLVNSVKDILSSRHEEDKGDLAVRLKRDCVGIMAAFKLNGPFNAILVVANAHLYWDPEWADVKLAQAKYLLSRLAKFNSMVADMYGSSPAVIVAGDFNSIPGDTVYQFLVSGNSATDELEESSKELPFPLRSSYGHSRGEPPFTNCTPDFTNTLDYIFFNPSVHLRPVSLLELPQKDAPDVVGGLPNYYHPSDHLPIGAEFEFTRT